MDKIDNDLSVAVDPTETWPRRLGAFTSHTFRKPSDILSVLVLGGVLATIVALRHDRPRAEADYQNDRETISALQLQLDIALNNPAVDQRALVVATAEFVQQVSPDKYPVTNKAGQAFYYPDWEVGVMKTRNSVDAQSLRRPVDALIADFESPEGRSNFIFSHEANHVIVSVKHELNKIQSQHAFQDISPFSRWPVPQLTELNEALHATHRPDDLMKLASY